MRKILDNYDEKHPNLVFEIIDYFSINSDLNEKTVLKFCDKKAIPCSTGKGITYTIQPKFVKRICDILCDNNMMDCIKGGNDTHGVNSNYITIPKGDISQERIKIMLNSIVYGFGYIYNLYKKFVVPIIFQNKDDDYALGTGFKMNGGIVTAKHCLEGAKSIAIKGYSGAELNRSRILIHQNQNVDLAFIEVGRNNEVTPFVDNISIMDEILVLGYPLIPRFLDFLTTEKATVSSKAESRITPTRGSVAAVSDTLDKMELMLITAKIKGGNSGGPIVNKQGSVVGVACNVPIYEDNGNYDDLGYGIAIPIKYFTEILNPDKSLNFGEKVNFVDCED